MSRRLFQMSLCLALAGTMSCKLVKTTDSEGVTGPGSSNINPYQGTGSDAAKLALISYNGCEMLGTSQIMGKGTTNIPYPDCRYRLINVAEGILGLDPNVPQPTEPMKIVAGQRYLLNQLEIANVLWNKHTDPSNLNDFTKWVTQTPPFNKLDWDGLGVFWDEYLPSMSHVSPTAWHHKVLYGNANWMKVKDDTYKVDVLDSSGQVRASVNYDHKDFLVETPGTDHSEVMWITDQQAAPKYPGDNVVVQSPPSPPGFPPVAPLSFHSLFKIDLQNSINPTKLLSLPDSLSGDGSIRVTWSQLPDDPFYFPVRFVGTKEVPATCYSATNWTDRVPCTFGLVPAATFSHPKNGRFYEPGETFQIHLALKDNNGNYLHPKEHFPNWNQAIGGDPEANGLTYFEPATIEGLWDQAGDSGWQISGPKQEMKPLYKLNDTSKYWRTQTENFIPGVGNTGIHEIAGPFAGENITPGAREAVVPTVWSVTLPKDAKKGTYTLYWKMDRNFMGERIDKIGAFDFQVGQAEPTGFPDRVGGCQMCHRGAISLDNVRHGLSVNYVEGCKTCHVRDYFNASREGSFQRLIHRFHMMSSKFPKQKNQCTLCHLTRESALTPSYVVCSACHANPHGGQFWNTAMTPDSDPTITNTVYSDCGSACHALTPPTQHILPPQ